jgi:hypothetical protein
MYLLNKNVTHNGKAYPKGSEIKEGDEGFKAVVGAGHASEVKPVEAVKGEPEKQSAQSEKPAKSGK